MEISGAEQPTAVDPSASKREQRSVFKEAIVKILSCIAGPLNFDYERYSTEALLPKVSRGIGTLSLLIFQLFCSIVNELVGAACFFPTEVDSKVARKATGTPQEPIQQQPLPKTDQLTQALASISVTGAVSSDSPPPGGSIAG